MARQIFSTLGIVSMTLAPRRTGDGPYNQRSATPDNHRDDDTGPIRVDQDRESD